MMTNEQRRERKAQTCKHFNGTQNTCCDAGVDYDTVRAPAVKRAGVTLPCIPYPPFQEEGVPEPPCSKREVYTPEELAELEREAVAHSKRTMNAIMAITAHAGKYTKGESRRALIECPNCKGKLRYSRSGYNGHIHARCGTDGCVAFMQ